jgi:2-amino-4-hydroxy-6-hydroxymethyldihydropteridine diphosphokinase
MVNTLYLLLGTNLGDRDVHMKTACLHIEKEIGTIKQVSALYETEPWGVTEQPAYWNQIVVVHTPQSPLESLKHIHAIEKLLGRQRRTRWEARPIDIDILYLNDAILDLPELSIPHPRIAERRFVLIPLAEIAPDFIHPIYKKTTLQLLEECPDTLGVKKIHSL